MPHSKKSLFFFSLACMLLARLGLATQQQQQQQQLQPHQLGLSQSLQSLSTAPPSKSTALSSTSKSKDQSPALTRPTSTSTSKTRLVGKAIMGETGTEQEWLNAVMSQLAPRFSEFAAEVLNEQIEPLIKKVLKTSHLPVKFRFVKTDFGTVPPQITNLRTHKTPEGQEAKSVIVDFDFVYLGDCNLEVSIMGIHSGVRDFQMSGRGRVVLKPTTKSLPLVGGLQLCFLEPPAINFDLEGIADLCDWPILRRKVRKEIREDTAKKSVYPNRLIIPMAGSVDAMHVKCFEPTGLVAVKIQSASNLPRKKGIRIVVGQDKPDPYVNVRVGAQVYKTTVIKNKANPVWPEEEPWLYFMLETPKGHRLRLDVFDKDSMSHDEFLGFARVDVEDYLGLEVPKTATVALENDPMENNLKKPVEVSGDVTFSTRWIPLVQANTTDLSNASAVVVTFFVYSCNNLVNMTQDGGIISDGNAPSTQLQVTLGSAVKEGEIKKKKFHPEYEECFTFMIPKQDISLDLIGKIDVKDVEKGEILGSLSLSLQDLASAGPIQRRIASLSPDNPYITITYSANMKVGI